ncbi:diacylglycerol kinase family protein [Alicyclobacillaceae bacterium I2511]|nr:diacylglycerol kinase family protein [Alicyclobacillaceae bacterium I2511]
MERDIIFVPPELQRKPRQSLFQSFARAFIGLGYMVATERNARIHCLVAMVWFLVNMVVRPATYLVLEGVLAVFLVMGFEAVNTSVERVVDVAACGEWRTWAEHAKDTAAGSVLLATMAAVLTGIHVLAATWPWHWWLFTGKHWLGSAVACAGLLFILAMCFSAWRQREVYWIRS